MHLQHQIGEVISRVNAFLGFNAVGRIRIVQKPLAGPARKQKPVLRPLSGQEKTKLAGVVAPVGDEGLRGSLERLGATILAKRS